MKLPLARPPVLGRGRRFWSEVILLAALALRILRGGRFCEGAIQVTISRFSHRLDAIVLRTWRKCRSISSIRAILKPVGGGIEAALAAIGYCYYIFGERSPYCAH
jgi:hypothetical protein